MNRRVILFAFCAALLVTVPVAARDHDITALGTMGQSASRPLPRPAPAPDSLPPAAALPVAPPVAPPVVVPPPFDPGTERCEVNPPRGISGYHC